MVRMYLIERKSRLTDLPDQNVLRQTLFMTPLRLRDQSAILFSQILTSASRGTLIYWGRTQPLIGFSGHFAGSVNSRFQTKLCDSQVISDFRNKLRMTEDMISKLGHSLREITEQR